MVNKVSKFKADNHSPYPTSSGIKEKIRASFNSKQQTLGLLEDAGDTKKIDHMEKIEGKITHQISAPVDYSSPKIFQKIMHKHSITAEHLVPAQNTLLSTVTNTVSPILKRSNH